MSDRPEDRPVPPLARVSARHARTQPMRRDSETMTQRDFNRLSSRVCTITPGADVNIDNDDHVV